MLSWIRKLGLHVANWMFRRGHDRPGVQVRGHLGVIRLSHPRDLLRLEDPTDPSEGRLEDRCALLAQQILGIRTW